MRDYTKRTSDFITGGQRGSSPDFSRRQRRHRSSGPEAARASGAHAGPIAAPNPNSPVALAAALQRLYGVIGDVIRFVFSFLFHFCFCFVNY